MQGFLLAIGKKRRKNSNKNKRTARVESDSPNYQCNSVSNETPLTSAFVWISLYFTNVLHNLHTILYM